MTSINLGANAYGHPVTYDPNIDNGRVMTADVYRLEGAPSYILIYCTRCGHTSTIDEGNKKFHYEKDRFPKELLRHFNLADLCRGLDLPVHPSSLGGTLSVEPFRCQQEYLEQTDGMRSKICGYQVAIENNIIRRA
jgi:hypothetical protein